MAIDLQQIGQMLGGFGAGIQGQLPQFIANQQNQQRLNMAQQQMDAEAAEKAEKRKLEMDELRKKAFFQDIRTGNMLLKAGRVQDAFNLFGDRAMTLSQIGSDDPSDTATIFTLLEMANSGGPAAQQALAEAQREFDLQEMIGQASGYIETPEQPEAFRSLEARAQAAGLVPGSPEYQQFMMQGGPSARTPAQTDIGKAKMDLDAGLITPEQYNSIVANSGQEAIDVFGEAGKLRTEFTANPVVKEFASQATAFGRISASAAQADAAGDLALIFNYMKLLDPGSTVREGEFANAQNATGIPTQIRNAYNRAMEGTRLAPEQRTQFLNRSNMLYKDAEQGFAKVYDQFKGIAERRGLPVQDALIDYRYYGGSDIATNQMTQAAISAGVTPEEWQAMTPEEKAAF